MARGLDKQITRRPWLPRLLRDGFGLGLRLAVVVAAVVAAPLPAWAGAGRSGLGFRQVSLELPGPPAEVITADLNRDGRPDLVVVVDVSEWTQKEVEDTSEMDQVRGLVDAMTIIPAVDDRREVRVLLARPDGGYRAVAPMVLPRAWE